MLSIGDIVDKLCIENLKVFSLREKLYAPGTSEEDRVAINKVMIDLNENRGIITNALDEKVRRVVAGEEPNVALKKIKTYRIGAAPASGLGDFGKCIEDLVSLWRDWMRNNAIAKDESKSVPERALASRECERLVDLKYDLADQIDSFFEVRK
jgi:hypothetical protein